MLPQKLTQLLFRGRLRPLFLALVVALIITEIVALSPSPLEESTGKNLAVDPESLMTDDEVTLATGIPHGKIPEYSIDQFQYVSTQGTEKQWKLIADRAFLYNKERLVHSRHIKAFLFDPEGKITIVTGKEGKYFMGKRDLEVFGDVHTLLPDGFELVSEYLLYKPGERKIEIPTKYFVHGDGHEQEGQQIKFDSYGMDFEMARSLITLPLDVKVIIEKPPAPVAPLADGTPGPPGPPDRTVIQSDHAVINRAKQLAHFTMNPAKPLDKRFVHITQPTMFTRGRRADMSYGDFSKLLQYMVVYEDVLVKEITDGTSLRYGTGGRADFDARSDVIRLTQFPQVYQDNDTVTGDIIIMHRDTDLVEVEHSNAFSAGN
jgi:LPS export ABC transporter protein LptC